ncbi:uncharacterized protein EAE97_008403 [Botrytis byssoidea]|uniref:Uncharacterized protein n=1 Tax=Botrytis byssoidea TaxID=139641 RepID=A0A9P5M0G3_9HELO|nr:uncharacterized protein EAE97_008403 [Botrytis byssoidea]KAF7934043.1 hypothetical protein EAE97_008403 [Botrytis byssoidea]
MAFTTRSFSFISLSHSSSSLSPYSPLASSKSRSKQPKYPRKNRSKSKSRRKGPNEQEQEQEQERELLTEAFRGEKDEECPCPSCMYPDACSGESEPSSSSSSSSSSFGNHNIDAEESFNIAEVENGGKFLERRKGRREGGRELKMKWGLAWLRGRVTRGRGYGY